MADSSLRWLQHHSSMDESYNDGVIIAATSIEQLEANLRSCEEELLPEDVVNAFDYAWKLVRSECPQYFWTSFGKKRS
jgi:aflatoxin B1 aldehyde reductase